MLVPLVVVVAVPNVRDLVVEAGPNLKLVKSEELETTDGAAVSF